AGMSSSCEEPMTKYIRNESMKYVFNNKDSIIIINPTTFSDDGKDKQHSIHRTCGVEHENPEYSELDETVDMDIALRCAVYMSGFKCHKGDYCDKLHRFPREDRVMCKYHIAEGCERTASDCWFWHPGEMFDKFVPDDDAPMIVQSMGDIMSYIKNELSKDPDKYKSRLKLYVVNK
ncbi:unnamed protein product, partial [Meganyctiphanes norvegica]